LVAPSGGKEWKDTQRKGFNAEMIEAESLASFTNEIQRHHL